MILAIFKGDGAKLISNQQNKTSSTSYSIALNTLFPPGPQENGGTESSDTSGPSEPSTVYL